MKKTKKRGEDNEKDGEEEIDVEKKKKEPNKESDTLSMAIML